MTDLQVKCFLEVAYYLNFTRAARELYISQSNISRQIASLEEELGIALFDRNSKGVKLTVQGHMLAETLSGMTAEWERALKRAKNSARKFQGCITVGCQEHIKANSFLSQVLLEFRDNRPEIQIIKERCTQKKLVEGLLNDYYDVILIADHDIKMVSGIEMLTLFYSQVGIVIHKKHPLFSKKKVRLSDFKDSVFLRYLPMKLKPEDDYLHNICRAYGFEPKIEAEFENFEEILFAIEMGEGVSLIFEEDEIISNRNLRFVPIEENVPQKYLPMQLTKRAKNKNSAVNDFFAFAQRYARNHFKQEYEPEYKPEQHIADFQAAEKKRLTV